MVLEGGVIEGRKVFANIIKYIRMGASSNFGNMFSVLGASAFLPFLPMAPIQILTNNMLYDFSQVPIPNDAVDEELVAHPRPWNIGEIKRFILCIGPISSIFDYTTFFVMLYLFKCWDPSRAPLFQTGWFVESIMTQTLVIHIIRTNKIPFFQSRASWPLLITTLTIMVFGAWLPYSPLASSLGLTHLPALYWPILLLTLLAYTCLTQGVKVWLLEDEMDLGQGKLVTPLGRSTESHGQADSKNALRRFQKFLVRKRFKMPVRGRRFHRAGGIGLLRAAVLGANDGIVSTSSLLIGVAAAHGTHRSILVAGIAGLVSGGMSMAASEYVSVHSQADTEAAELALERKKLKQDNKGERQALTAIYVARGLEPLLASQVAQQLVAYDELGAYARDELGISEKFRARPLQASLSAACSFAVGAMMPLMVTAIAPEARLIPIVSLSSLAVLALMGGLAARAGGAKVIMGAMRVTFWGGLAMGMTAGIGWLVGAIA